MATKKDLIEAQSFSRRRLLTAFTSGAPGGKELEPAQPLRAVVAGVVLTAMVILGGVFYGLVRPGLPDGWEDNSVILVKDTGARYVAIGGTLYPVLNTASARLLMPAGEYRVITTDQDSIADIEVGSAVGILGAPDTLPPADGLLANGWVACTVDGGTGVALPAAPLAAPVSDAAVVTRDDDTFVVAGDRRYAVDPGSLAPVLRALGLDASAAREVDGTWLGLLQPGVDLAPIEITGAGTPVPGTDLVVGNAVHQTGAPDDERFVITSDGALARLSPVAYQLYLLGTGDELGGASALREVDAADTEALPNAGQFAGGVDWPRAALSPIDGDAVPCAILRHAADGSDDTVLGVATDGAALPAAGEVRVAVGHGALVRTSTSVGDTGTVHLVDETGTAFAIPGADADLLARLGYDADDDVTAVSSAWLQFLPVGPALTIAAAGATPSSPTQPLESDPTPDPGPSADGDSGSGVRAAGEQCAPGDVTFTPEIPVGLALLQSERAWQTSTGSGVLVAVVDSGIDTANRHLAGAVAGGVDLVGDGAGPYVDLAGHGTAIAGQIAARPVDGSGVVGLAPDARLLSVRVFQSTDSSSVDAGFGLTADRIAAGIRWAVDNGADVINVSLSDPAQVPAVSDAVAYASANGALVVASAGNRTTAEGETDGPRYPAADAGALAVTGADTAGLVTDSSFHGPHVAVAALGSQILTATTGGGDCLYAADAPSSSYSTAYASAAAALVAQAHPDETPAQWTYRLEATASRSDPDARDDVSGWGVIQPADAIALLPDPGLRGPVSPFFDTAGAPLPATGVALTPSTGESPFGLTRETATLAAIGGAALIGTLGVIGVLRLRRRADAAAADARAVPRREGGLLTRPTSAPD